MINYNGKNILKAKSMRKNLTPWERKLWLFFLKNYPLHIYKQRPIANYIVDFYCPKAKLVIELDGSQHYKEAGEQEDEIRTRNLEKEGIKVLRISNIEIDKNFQSVCEYIDYEIKNRCKPLSQNL